MMGIWPKLGGLLLLASGSFFCGLTALQQEKKTVCAAEESAQLLRFLAERVETDAPPCPALFAQAAASGQFPHLPFLGVLAEKTKTRPLSVLLPDMLEGETSLSGEVRGLLLQLGGFLGLREKRETVAALLSLEHRLSFLLPAMHKQMGEHRRLYPTLGLLAGIFLDILLL